MKSATSILCWMFLSCGALLAGERYLYIRLDPSASDQTKEEFRKWAISQAPNDSHGMSAWDVRDTNQIWHINIDVTKVGSPWPALAVKTQDVATITSKLTATEKAKVTAEAHSDSPKTLLTNKVATAEAVAK